MGSRAKARRHRNEDPVIRERAGIDGAEALLREAAMLQPDRSKVLFVCIGTDCSTGDSFGPWVGTMLKEAGWPHVIGTLEHPCDADHYERLVAEIPTFMTVVAIDACLGKKNETPSYMIGRGPLFPAQAVGKRLPPIGDYSIAGIVAPHSVKPYWVLQHASLFEVMGMARMLADTINEVWTFLELNEKGRSRMTKKPLSLANNAFQLPNGQTIAYYDSTPQAGESTADTAIVLLHGFCGSSAYWVEVVSALSTHGRVIAPDLRGHGGSTAPDQSPYEMEQFAEDLFVLVSELGIERICLFGHSLGGYVSLAFAERHPELLKSFALVHSTAKPDSEEAKGNRDKAAKALLADGIAPFVEGLVPKLFAPAHKETMAAAISDMIEIGRGTSAAGAAATALGMKARPDRTGVLEGLDVPRLLVAGSEDGVIAPANTFTVDGPHVTQALLEGSGHMSMIEAPEQLVHEMIAFLKSL
ncbi:spore protease YyaC [Paenibacillus lignilyticus]